MKKETGGAAFPTKIQQGTYSSAGEDGMTLRDYFAAQVMPHLMSGQGPDYWKICAERAYEMADAMIRARDK